MRKERIPVTKRIICLILAVVLLLGLALTGVVQVLAVSEMKASDEAIVILKAEEGFSQKPYWDYAQWTVGYGTKCPDDKLEEYKQNGITEEEAEVLLREHITRFELEVNKFIDKTGISLNQNQFDALVSFVFNLGRDRFRQSSLLKFLNSAHFPLAGGQFDRWIYADGKVMQGLVKRRAAEKALFLEPMQ
jgi:lysozyme